MAKLAIFIDAGYINQLAEKEFGIWVDYGKFSNKILETIAAKTSEPIDMLRTYYYDCLPYQGDPPTREEAERFAKARSFHDFLARQPRFTIRQGRLKFRGTDAKGQPIFQQKRVDLMLGLDFSLLSVKRSVSHLAIITGDSDLLPAFEVAQNEGVLVWLFHGPRKSKVDGMPTFASELWDGADERFELAPAFMKQVEFQRNRK